MRTRHTALSLSTTVLMALTGVVAAAGPAVAASSITCTGTSAITYTPGINNTPRDVHFDETDTFSSCTSTGVTITSGTSTSSVDFEDAACTSPPGLFDDPAYLITWSNNATSTIDLTFTDVIIGGTEQVTGVGTVTSGQFVGGAVLIVWLYPVLNPLQCLTSQGVTTQNGTLVAQITQL